MMDQRIAIAVATGVIIILIAMALYGYLSGAWDSAGLQ